MRRRIDIEVKAGLFIFFGLTLIMASILLLNGGDSLFQKSYTLYVVIPDAAGLANGAMVRSGGLKVGRVSEITFSEHYENVRVSLKILGKYKPRIHSDSLVRLQTQGMLGDKYLEITAGSPGKPPAEDGETIESETSKDLSSMLAEGGNAMQLLKESLVNIKKITSEIAEHNNMRAMIRDFADTASNLKVITEQLKSGTSVSDLNLMMKNMRVVSDRVKNGEGTIGALFSDPSLYEDLKHLVGGANRNNMLKFFVRQAVKTSDDAEKKQEEEEKKGAKPAAQ